MILTETEVEEEVYRCFLLSTTHSRVNFVELGAGNGAQSLKFMRFLRKAQGFTSVESALCVGVEPYPPHFPALIRNMETIQSVIVFGV